MMNDKWEMMKGGIGLGELLDIMRARTRVPRGVLTVVGVVGCVEHIRYHFFTA
jgi:hypothetical protein